MVIESDGFTDAYRKLCVYLLENGMDSAPRKLATREVIGGIVRVKNPRTRMINCPKRKLSRAFAVGEWIWCMSGRNDLEMISYYAPSYEKYSDDGEVLNGAYGIRIMPHMDTIISLLKDDKDSRRAVIPIYNAHDVGLKSNDIPCTLSLQFFIRDNKLCMQSSMRSNDIYLGFLYDIFNFSMMQEYVAAKLEMDIGEYVHVAGSFHYYKKDEKKIMEMVSDVEPEIYMDYMPSEELDSQLKILLSNEERLRNGKSREAGLNTYFSRLQTILETYQIQRKKI